jgi:hypothetical protein
VTVEEIQEQPDGSRQTVRIDAKRNSWQVDNHGVNRHALIKAYDVLLSFPQAVNTPPALELPKYFFAFGSLDPPWELGPSPLRLRRHLLLHVQTPKHHRRLYIVRSIVNIPG